MNAERGTLNERKGRQILCRSSFIIHRSAFTMTELLIVIGIIVLVLALALPAFNFLTGSRSTEAASNQIAAFLGRARNEAIGLQQTRGVMFYIDPKSQQITMTIVQDAGVNGLPNIDLYLDLTADHDTITLPRGVGVEFIDDGGPNSARNDRYLGFNTVNANPGSGCSPTTTWYGGVILFDSRGQITTRTYAFRTHQGTQYTTMGALLYPVQPADTYQAQYNDVVPVNPTIPANANYIVRSELGFALFEMDAYKNACSSDPLGDPLHDLQIAQPGAAYAGSFEQLTKEDWLDNNATPVLVNRYNGTLTKAE